MRWDLAKKYLFSPWQLADKDLVISAFLMANFYRERCANPKSCQHKIYFLVSRLHAQRVADQKSTGKPAQKPRETRANHRAKRQGETP